VVVKIVLLAVGKRYDAAADIFEEFCNT